MPGVAQGPGPRNCWRATILGLEPLPCLLPQTARLPAFGQSGGLQAALQGLGVSWEDTQQGGGPGA